MVLERVLVVAICVVEIVTAQNNPTPDKMSSNERLELKCKLSDFKFGLDGNVIQWNCTARSSNMPVDVVLP